MELIQQCPPVLVSEALSPAWPYEGFFAILSEVDAITAVEDQVTKLGSDFDRSLLTAFYRLLWLLNDTTRHKTFQGYLSFKERAMPRACGFGSEILLCAFHPESSQLIIGLDAIVEIAAEFKNRLTLATASLEDRRDCRIYLTPVRTKFGEKPPTPQPPNWGYGLSLKAEVW